MSIGRAATALQVAVVALALGAWSISHERVADERVEALKSNHVFSFLLAANAAWPPNGRDPYDYTEQFREAVVGDDFRRIVEAIAEVGNGPYRSDFPFVAGQSYFYSVDHRTLENLPHSKIRPRLPFFLLPEIYELHVRLTYHPDTNFTVDRVDISNMQTYP